MARFACCNWAGENINDTPAGMKGYLGVVEHVQQGTEGGTHSWFMNPKSQASSHFGNPKVGKPDQFVDTHDKAWAEAAGNPYWLSIENEGHGEPLNENQLNNAAAILAEAHTVHGVPIVNTESPTVAGHGWHGMGGAAWGGHYDCPGNAIKDQRTEINRRALALIGAGVPAAPPVLTAGATIVAVMARTAGGYATIGPDGGVYNFGSPFYGSMGGKQLSAPMVTGAWTPAGDGYWLVSADGGVFAFGAAQFHGSAGGTHMSARVVGMAATPTGGGYWLVAADGGIFAYGDAQFFGSMGGKALVEPIVGMATTHDALGYWLVSSDGGLFAFGDAGFFGSMGGKALAAPIVGMAATPDGHGYWLAGADGGVFAYGNASFRGSASGLNGAPDWHKVPLVGIVAAGDGYDQVRVDNQVFSWA